MNKTRKFGLCLLGAIVASVALNAREKPVEISTVINSPLQGKAWVEKCVEQYPETLFLADDQVRKTEEGNASLEGTYSEQLFGKKYVEFDRTIMTLHSLRLILDGSDRAYAEFTDAQPADVKLSFGSFRRLHLQGRRLLTSNWRGMSEQQIGQAMETALVLGDIGKSEKARELFRIHGANAPDHDDFYEQIIWFLPNTHNVCPSFDRLPNVLKELLQKSANLAHYGHITHLEGTASMFSKLKQSKIPSNDPFIIAFDLFVHSCDVAGALGHVNNRSSLVYTEPTHKAMQAMGEAVRLLTDPNQSEQDALNAYLIKRASWVGLDLADNSDRVLARVGAMMRLFNPAEGKILRKAIGQLDKKDRERILFFLDPLKTNPFYKTPTYMPALLVNLSNNTDLGKTKEERLAKALQFGLSFIARVFERHQDQLERGTANNYIPLNFNEVAGVAKKSPRALKGDFTIDAEGTVHLTPKEEPPQAAPSNDPPKS